MTWNPNVNHPGKGSTTTVEPIRSRLKVDEIKDKLKDHPRNYLLFVLAINSGIRVGDLLKLKVSDVKDIQLGQDIVIKEKKTGKKNHITINGEIYRALQNYLQNLLPNDNDFLFVSRKGSNHITIQRVGFLVKEWTEGLSGNYGAHSLRKTFGYMQRVIHGTPFELICKRYNHSDPSVTMRYLGIQDEEIKTMCMNEI